MGAGMHFIIHAKDKKGVLPTRQAQTEAHRAHLNDTSRFGVKIVISGPLVTDDGQTSVGSLFVVEAPDRKAVEAFHAADPFKKAGIWERIDISAFIKRRDNR